jgi:hypothetical protein
MASLLAGRAPGGRRREKEEEKKGTEKRSGTNQNNKLGGGRKPQINPTIGEQKGSDWQGVVFWRKKAIVSEKRKPKENPRNHFRAMIGHQSVFTGQVSKCLASQNPQRC